MEAMSRKMEEVMAENQGSPGKGLSAGHHSRSWSLEKVGPLAGGGGDFGENTLSLTLA